jgi:hypothetical protein
MLAPYPVSKSHVCQNLKSHGWNLVTVDIIGEIGEIGGLEEAKTGHRRPQKMSRLFSCNYFNRSDLQPNM